MFASLSVVACSQAMVLSERMGEIMREDDGLRFTEVLCPHMHPAPSTMSRCLTYLSAQFVYLYEKHLILPTVRSEGYYLVLRESLQVRRDAAFLVAFVSCFYRVFSCSD